jgi:two-component system nitrate/nitrite response regulator NarL
MPERTKVFIVDDHMIVIDGIKKRLADESGFDVLGSASNGLEAVQAIKSSRPDIVIMDISMPTLDGIEATREIKKFDSSISILVFTMHSEAELVLALFRNGVSGYVLKGDPSSDLVLALKAISRGGSYFSGTVEQKIREHLKDLELGDAEKVKEMRNGVVKLSLREKEVFPLLADGLSIKEIADRLSISTKTVETHKYNIMGKLGADSLADLTKLAIKRGLIKL